MAVLIPTFQSTSSKFRQDIVLGGLAVTLTMRFNTRSGFWMLSITDGTYTFKNKKLVANWPIFKRSGASFPSLSGDIIAQRVNSDVEGELTYDNLNDGWDLYYFTEEEIEEWEEKNGLG